MQPELQGVKALHAAEDRDLRSHSLTTLLMELGGELGDRWQRQARVLDKLYALGDEVPAEVFGPEDGEAALQAAQDLLAWAAEELR